MNVRVRIAPSPTGDPHVGTAYMALFNMIFARSQGGKMILRIEDTDNKRSRPEYEKNIYKALKWCGIEWDEGPDKGGAFGPYRQSERLEIYQKYCQILLDEGKAYKCFATEKELQEIREENNKKGIQKGYDRRYRNLNSEQVREREEAKQKYVVRLKIPLEGECSFYDEIKGNVSFPYKDIDDQILLKSDGFPTYHLANVVDDHLMGVTHIIRGDEWLSSVPKHILLYDYFNWSRPQFFHMPLLFGKDGKKLSKRKNPTSIFYYRDTGYLPEAFINFLSLMGYSMPNDEEIYSLNQLIKDFQTKRIGKSSAIFDTQKLNWLNQHYIIHHFSKEQLWEVFKKWQFNEDFILKLIPLCQPRMETLGDFVKLCSFFFVSKLDLSPDLLCPKNIEKEKSAALLQGMIWHMDESENWKKDGFEKASREIASIFDLSHKKIIMPILFVAITGKQSGLPLFSSIDILGKDKTRSRLMEAIELLGGISKKKLKQLKKMWDAKKYSENKGD